MRDQIVSSILFLVALMTVFFVHEGGHLLLARLFGVHVAKINFGFGRKVWTRTDRHGTRWAVRVFPFSGSVQLTNPDIAAPDEFARAPLWRRFLIVLAGPAANMAFAVVVFTLFFFLLGQPSTPAILTGLQAGGAAEHAGLEVGDRIVALDGYRIDRYQDIIAYLKRSFNGPVGVTIARNGTETTVPVRPVWEDYIDLNGFPRAASRLEILGQETSLKLSAVRAVNGLTTGSDDAARAALKDAMGRPAVITLRTMDRRVYSYDMRPSRQANAGLWDEASPDYNLFYPGPLKGDVYLRRRFAEAALDAFATVRTLTAGMAYVVLHPVPADYESIRPDATIAGSRPGDLLQPHLFVHTVALLSIFIGLLNLMPFPGFDGYMLMNYALEGVLGQNRARTVRPYAWRIVILSFAFALLAGNAVSMAGRLARAADSPVNAENLR
jgi:regulator of sigma E protease